MGGYNQVDPDIVDRCFMNHRAKIKAGLARAKKAGVLLGSNNPKVAAGLLKWRQEQVFKRVKEVIRKSKEPKPHKPTKRELADKRVVQSLQTLLNFGYSYKKIAYCFNMARTPTRQGKRWSAGQVFRVVKRNGLKREKPKP